MRRAPRGGGPPRQATEHAQASQGAICQQLDAVTPIEDCGALHHCAVVVILRKWSCGDNNRRDSMKTNDNAFHGCKDQTFLGYFIDKGVSTAVKVVRKAYPQEKAGVFDRNDMGGPLSVVDVTMTTEINQTT
ncbi:hypothetical protein GUJ93_ZPchr0002g23551 [Zizania palustris]|uniref:Uncharacterized protein n=1 Tax=Zizania palustris TaxID=103762 RepID=A0A8J5VWN4_ZIZPA|nr:hypothetical protein GUJ93_ZPchr0002g23551 [Zizania palustris]